MYILIDFFMISTVLVFVISTVLVFVIISTFLVFIIISSPYLKTLFIGFVNQAKVLQKNKLHLKTFAFLHCFTSYT